MDDQVTSLGLAGSGPPAGGALWLQHGPWVLEMWAWHRRLLSPGPGLTPLTQQCVFMDAVPPTGKNTDTRAPYVGVWSLIDPTFELSFVRESFIRSLIQLWWGPLAVVPGAVFVLD